jgi:Peptidase family M28
MTQARVIRVLIIGLPVGLIIGLVIAMRLYFRDEAAAEAEAARGYTSRPVSLADIKSHVEKLAGTIGPRHMGDPGRLNAAVKYLESTLGPANLGYKVARHTYKIGDVECHNLALEIPGTHPERGHEIVLVGAHYDTVSGTPGADDNASGVAAGISLAQAFAKSEHQRTLRFVFFSNEEPPHFQTENMGSLVYAKECKRRGESIVAMLSLETIGYYSTAKGSQKIPPGFQGSAPDTGDFLAVVGNTTSAALVGEVRATFARNNTLPVVGIAGPATTPEQAWSDHWSFWQQGYPAVMVTDTAIFRNPNYHLPADTADTLDYERLTLAVKGLESVIRQLANP